jgi:hypothetical protein
VFNAGKEIEAMKRLTLHHIASSLYRFIASLLLLPSFVYKLPSVRSRSPKVTQLLRVISSAKKSLPSCHRAI